MYTDKVMEHFKEQQNQGKLEDPDGVGKVGNEVCGDVMWLYIKVAENAEGEKIVDEISWETFGCVAAIATSSMITELAEGETLDKAFEITNKEIADELDGLPPVKMHCSVLASDALSEAIYDYLNKTGGEIPEEMEEKHVEIQKEMEEMKEEYGEYMEKEEELHEQKE